MDLRREKRYSIAVAGHYRRGTGVRFEIAIRNLSEFGCQFSDYAGRLDEGAEISVRIGAIGPIGAQVKWIRARQVGVEFEQPLYPSVLDYILANGGTNELPARSSPPGEPLAAPGPS